VALADSLPEIETMIIYEQDGKLAWRASRELKSKMQILEQ
jgi:hypothetical protein